MYFNLGIDHILDINGYDHMLFIVCLSVSYQLNEIKKVLWLLTAFTIGHSITLALSTLNWVSVDTNFIELLIKVTILITAMTNIATVYLPKVWKNYTKSSTTFLAYTIVFFFGLIHGLGFATYLKTLLFDDESLLLPLLQFNLGVELGQIVIFIGYFIVTLLVFKFVPKLVHYWLLLISSTVFIIALYLIFL